MLFPDKAGMEQFIDIDNEIGSGVGCLSRWNTPLLVGNLVFQILVIPIITVIVIIIPSVTVSFAITLYPFMEPQPL